ncbi:Hemocyte protein-glutamine gamma-glutamyltransferase [Geodia barretti]|nr:Hemocyte protein-glutamine gamma-glutamyltransferase [Geodia barretti]
MARPDLGLQYSGWQAIDATPQEISPHSKSYVVGPASLSAVKTGQSMDYDTDFVVAEVNADIRDYCEVEKDKFVLAVTDTKRVGKTVSTKTVGSNKRCDVTDSYKFKEGSELERAALGLDEPDGASDVQLDVSFSKQPAIGDNFDVIVTAKCSVKEVRTVRVSVAVSSVSYTGGSGTSVKKEQGKISLTRAGGSGSYTVAVRSSDYLCCLRDQALLSVTVLAVVSETGKGWVSKVPCRLHRPDLTLLVDGKQVEDDEWVELSAGKSYPVKAYFTNPLQKPLTNVVFLIEGARLTKPLKIPGKNTGKGKVAEVSFAISPRSAPRKRQSQSSKLIVTCQSKELKGVMGTACVTITK